MYIYNVCISSYSGGIIISNVTTNNRVSEKIGTLGCQRKSRIERILQISLFTNSTGQRDIRPCPAIDRKTPGEITLSNTNQQSQKNKLRDN